MKVALKVLVLVGLVVTTAAFTNVSVFDVTDESRGLVRMHHELVVDP